MTETIIRRATALRLSTVEAIDTLVKQVPAIDTDTQAINLAIIAVADVVKRGVLFEDIRRLAVAAAMFAAAQERGETICFAKQNEDGELEIKREVLFI